MTQPGLEFPYSKYPSHPGISWVKPPSLFPLDNLMSNLTFPEFHLLEILKKGSS